MSDPVRAMLQARGCAPDVVDGGLPGLVVAWSGVAGSVAGGYALTLDDYLNDMDLRYLIQAAVAVSTEEERARVRSALGAADDLLLAHTVPAPCLWGDDIAEEEGLDAGREWWYFRRPREPGAQLADDLERWGMGEGAE
jgi:hypothetical protein